MTSHRSEAFKASWTGGSRTRHPPLGSLGFRVVRCRVQGLGFRVEGLGFRVVRCRVQGLRFGVHLDPQVPSIDPKYPQIGPTWTPFQGTWGV